MVRVHDLTLERSRDEDIDGQLEQLRVRDRAAGMAIRYQALFVFHGAEERGLLGSRYHVAHPVVPLDKIVAVLRRLVNHQTLLIQSGKPVGVFSTHPDAPRVLLANSNLSERRTIFTA